MGDNTNGTITDSYFDSDLSSATQGIGNDANITDLGKTISDLQMPTIYGTGASIYANWNIDTDNGLSIGVDDGEKPWRYFRR